MVGGLAGTRGGVLGDVRYCDHVDEGLADQLVQGLLTTGDGA